MYTLQIVLYSFHRVVCYFLEQYLLGTLQESLRILCDWYQQSALLNVRIHFYVQYNGNNFTLQTI